MLFSPIIMKNILLLLIVKYFPDSNLIHLLPSIVVYVGEPTLLIVKGVNPTLVAFVSNGK